jgi:hypothetical protein
MKIRNIILVASLIIILVLTGCVTENLEQDLYTQDIYPITGNTYSVGSAILPYLNGYFTNGYIDDLYVGDDLEVTDDVNIGGTLDVDVITGQNIQVTGKVEADRLIGDVEGYSIDVVQVSDYNIALNDTISIVLLFVPDVIEINYSGRVQHDVTLDDGHTTGHSLVIITGVNTMTCNTNYTALINNGGAFGSRYGQNDAVNTIVIYGGNDGVDDSYIYGVGNWVTATKTLTLTFSTVANANDATNYVEIMAVAYR